MDHVLRAVGGRTMSVSPDLIVGKTATESGIDASAAPSAIARTLSVRDLQIQARRFLPRILYDFVAGGTDDERGVCANERQFENYRLLPRYLVDVVERSQRLDLFGRTYSFPFGIAPMGYVGLLRPDADLMLAKSAAAANIPYIMSGASVASLEAAVQQAPHNTWFQLYGARDDGISFDILERAWKVGIRTLVVTVDCPVVAKRERDIRNGFDLPVRMTPRLLLDGILHPRWTMSYLLSGGMPRMGNWVPYARPGAGAIEVADLMNSHFFAPQTWRHLQTYRERWRGSLVVKGILHPKDVVKAIEYGVDGIVLSNHGGRQLDAGATALDALALIPDEHRSRIAIMIDGGIRRGSDIFVALCLGARFVFVGRAVLYGLIAGGEAGALRAVSILAEELNTTFGQVGCTDMHGVGRDLIVRTH